ncbi:DUF3131 domain-containing protein [Roseivivax sp.]
MPALRPAHRSSLLFVLGLGLAAAFAVLSDGARHHTAHAEAASLNHSAATLPLAAPRALTPEDRAAARRAWRYFDTQTRSQTGLVDSVAGFPSTTLWDQGSYLLALVSARRLGLISESEFAKRTHSLLTGLEDLPLFEGSLPNKVYDTRSLAMVDYDNTPRPEGIGWSALDMGRMLMALRVLESAEPKLSPRVRALLASWDLTAMTKNGELWGAIREDGVTRLRQEGRLGYEQYAARAATLWGLDVIPAASARRVLDWREVQGIEVPVDTRRASAFRAITPILSEPFLLQALELGLDSETRLLAEAVYRAQEARYHATGHLTAVSEDHLDRTPHFLYATVFSNGRAWAVVDERGDFHPALRSQSVKASFGWDALYDTDYTVRLRDKIHTLGDLERGWPAGIYEADGSVNAAYTLNTNAVVLEAVHYMAFGPLWSLQ